MELDTFRERLLDVMERKDHWAWPAFAGLVPKSRLHIHFEQEYETYVRDFPVFLAHAYVQCPVAQVRRALAENIYEEETGGLSGGRSHAELFLEYPRGLGMDLSRFAQINLLDGASQFRSYLEQATQLRGWEVAAAVTTLFLEGTKYERGELDRAAPKRPEQPLEQHPLVTGYGLPVEFLALTRVHRGVEGGHRKAAWNIVLHHVGEEARTHVVESMEGALHAWVNYRDDVAKECGVVRAADGSLQVTP